MNRDRLFIALPLGQEQKSVLKKLMESLQPKLPFQKWVHQDDLHITLKFLGDTDSAEKTRVQTLIKETAASLTPFSLTLKRPGTFGKPMAPSILWVGVGGDLAALGTLQSQIEIAMKSMDIAMEDRTYSPHITIARKYTGKAPFSKEALSTADSEIIPEAVQWTADRIVLYRSHIGSNPMYEAIDQFMLVKPGVMTGVGE
ncbi:MAG: 2-5 ligase [Paenibacillus sp.]|nr:2-5 ligase [Paenibacillus sp.]